MYIILDKIQYTSTSMCIVISMAYLQHSFPWLTFYNVGYILVYMLHVAIQSTYT